MSKDDYDWASIEVGVAKEGYERAIELLVLCSRAQALIRPTEEGMQWLRDFEAYLRIQTGDNDAS
jgi:hypothetical protein